MNETKQESSSLITKYQRSDFDEGDGAFSNARKEKLTMNLPDRMTCEHAFRLLDDFLDHELSNMEQEQVQAHLEVCRMCAKEFRFQQEIIDTVRERVQRIAVSPTLRDKVTTALRQVQNETSVV